MPEVTLWDVAHAAGVSQSTASRVLNGSARRVRDEYAERVRDAAARLGYAVDLRAQATALQRSNTVSIVVPSLTDHAAMAIAARVLSVAEGRGFVSHVTQCPPGSDRAERVMRALRGQRPFAIVLVCVDPAGTGSGIAEELALYDAHGGRVAFIADSSHADRW